MALVGLPDRLPMLLLSSPGDSVPTLAAPPPARRRTRVAPRGATAAAARCARSDATSW